MGLFSRSPKAVARTATTTATTAATTTAAVDAATPTAVEDIAGDYTLGVTHTRLGFFARHAMVTTARGQFTEFEGAAHVDTANPSSSSAKVNIRAASISTGQADRDAPLRSG